MRQDSLQCLKTTKNTSHTKTLHGHHFCTSTPSSLELFKVSRSEPKLVGPANPTPREVKQLSDIDDQASNRFLTPVMILYRHDPSMHGKDPVRVIRDAIAEALVFYYPLAGRLREGPRGKLFVDCTGEGVFFVEAEAEVEVTHFGDPPRPPFPCFEELIYNVAPPFDGIVNSPLLFIQVTRLKCGGFILALRYNHVMTDGQGLFHFLTAVGQMARGARAPSIAPIWGREIFNARDPPRITCMHHLYEQVITEDSPPSVLSDHPDTIHRSFFFGLSELLAIRRLVPEQLRSRSTTFEVLTAYLWRCYVAALELDPQDKVYLSCVVNARGKFSPAIPIGYYGNTLASPETVTVAGKLCRSPVEYALELVKRAKRNFSEEYIRSLADLMVIKGRPGLAPVRSLIVSDLGRLGFDGVDFGWGKAAYVGPARAEAEGLMFYLPFKNERGEDGILVPLCLRARVMDIFEIELKKILNPIQSTL